MSNSAKPNRDSDISEIAAIRSAWISAVTAGDIDGDHRRGQALGGAV